MYLQILVVVGIVNGPGWVGTCERLGTSLAIDPVGSAPVDLKVRVFVNNRSGPRVGTSAAMINVSILDRPFALLIIYLHRSIPKHTAEVDLFKVKGRLS